MSWSGRVQVAEPLPFFCFRSLPSSYSFYWLLFKSFFKGLRDFRSKRVGVFFVQKLQHGFQYWLISYCSSPLAMICFVQLNFLNCSITCPHPCLPRNNDLFKEGRSGQLPLVFIRKCKIQRKEEKTHWSVDLPDSLPEKITLRYKFSHLSWSNNSSRRKPHF